MLNGEKRVAELLEASAELRRANAELSDVNAALRHRVARARVHPLSTPLHTCIRSSDRLTRSIIVDTCCTTRCRHWWVRGAFETVCRVKAAGCVPVHYVNVVVRGP